MLQMVSSATTASGCPHKPTGKKVKCSMLYSFLNLNFTFETSVVKTDTINLQDKKGRKQHISPSILSILQCHSVVPPKVTLCLDFCTFESEQSQAAVYTPFGKIGVA